MTIYDQNLSDHTIQCKPLMLAARQVVLQRRNVCFLVYFSLFCASCTDDRHARPQAKVSSAKSQASLEFKSSDLDALYYTTFPQPLSLCNSP